MNTRSAKSIWIIGIFFLALMVQASLLHAQKSGKEDLAVVEGTVCDSQNQAIAGAAVSLESADHGHTLLSSTDSRGHFLFQDVSAGTYAVHVKKEGYAERGDGPFVLRPHEVKPITLLLKKPQTAQPTKDSSHALEFSDEPQFTVAGVADTTSMGGHGSDRVLRNSEALAKDTASLAQPATRQATTAAQGVEDSGPGKATSLRALLAHEDRADLHSQLADIEESEGHALEAVQEYQRAAEMEPTEAHLFAWGAELLLHRAFEPAIQVFTKGHRLYSHSARMMLGLGAARYAQGSKEEAEQILLAACDMDPSETTPYLFVGKLQETENVLPPGWTDRMKRFVTLHPENAMAHYLYAVALAKPDGHQEDFEAVESQLQAAIKLDPGLGNAYLQLGILRSQRKDYAGAIIALQKAIETTPLPDEAHYRLADVYRRLGEVEKAARETELFKQCSEQKRQTAERERHEIRRFVYTLRSQSQPQPPAPKSQ